MRLALQIDRKHIRYIPEVISSSTYLEYGQEVQGKQLIERSKCQALREEQKEFFEAKITEQTLHRLIEIMRNSAAKEDAKESVGKDTMLVQLFGAGNALGGDVRRGGQEAARKICTYIVSVQWPDLINLRSDGLRAHRMIEQLLQIAAHQGV